MQTGSSHVNIVSSSKKRALHLAETPRAASRAAPRIQSAAMTVKSRPAQNPGPRRARTAAGSKRQLRYNAPALEKGLSILEVVAKTNDPLKTEEIALAVGRSRNEIYRMLQVLESYGYIARDIKGEGYVPTQKLFSLGMHAPPIMDLTAAAVPEMQALAHEVGHSVHLVVPSDEQIVFIARVESHATFGFSVTLGYRRPVLDSTSGLTLFAFQTPELQDRWLEKLRRSARKGADIEGFVTEAQRARSDGWVIRRSVTVEGVTDICAPIWSAESDGCIANLLVPFMRFIASQQKPEDVARACRRAADRISQRLRPH